MQHPRSQRKGGHLRARAADPRPTGHMPSSKPTLSGAPPQTVVVLGSYPSSLINFRGPLIAELVARGHRVYALAPDIDEEVAGRVRALGAEPISIRLGRTSLNPFGAVATLRDLVSTF